MALVALLTPDPATGRAVRTVLGEAHGVAQARTWERWVRVLQERPVTTAILDGEGVPGRTGPEVAVAELRRRLPSVSLVFVHRPSLDPVTLFRLGRAGIENLAVVSVDGLTEGLRHAFVRAAAHSTDAMVVRAIGPRLPSREVAVIRHALDGVQLGWSAERLAERVGLTRAHLSVRLRSHGLPSAGHLLLWAKLLHAGRWLCDPGRSAQSVSRQLEYSSGAAFRRALRHYVGCTPTDVKQGGGVGVILSRFLDVSGLGDSVRDTRSVA